MKRSIWISGTFVLLALATVSVAFLADDEGEGPYAVLSDELQQLREPSGFDFLGERKEGEGAPFFGEHRTLVHTFASTEMPLLACEAANSALREWGMDVGLVRSKQSGSIPPSSPLACSIHGSGRADVNSSTLSTRALVYSAKDFAELASLSPERREFVPHLSGAISIIEIELILLN